MSLNRPAALSVFLLTMFIIPVLLLLRIFFGHQGSQLMFWAEAAVCALYFVLIFLIGYWGFIGYSLRYILPGLFIVAVIVSYLKSGVLLPAVGESISIIQAVICVIAGVLLLFYIIKSLTAFSYSGAPVNLKFPFKNGTYYVLEGGDSKRCSLMNYHFAGSSHTKSSVNKSMRFATDIVKLKNGIFSKGLLPKTTEKFHIFGEKIFAPCGGTVIEVVDGLENEEPFSGHHPYNVGNHIVIQKDGVNVLLGHLQKGSLLVKTGDTVQEGQELAVIGNSGLTEFPHLHIQAMKANEASIWSGEGVPILFDSKFLIKNMLMKQS